MRILALLQTSAKPPSGKNVFPFVQWSVVAVTIQVPIDCEEARACSGPRGSEKDSASNS